MNSLLKRYVPISASLFFLILKWNNFSTINTYVNAAKTPYTRLKSKLKEIECLNGVRGLVSWDEMVLMKSGSSNARNQQKSALAAVIYDKETSSELEELLNSMKNHQDKDDNTVNVFDQAVVREARRDFTLSKLKKKEQAMREAELEGEGYQAWVEARTNNDYKKFQPVLQEILDLRKEIAKATRPHLSLYDGNIDIFERGMKSERLDKIFSLAKVQLIPLLEKVSKSETKSKYITPEALKGGDLWRVEEQTKLCQLVADKLGFDFGKGRLDVSVHPFTGGSHPTDVRITTRYSANNWLQGVAGTVHEVGHALYEQGRNPDYDNLPVSRALSMGVHESQSLFWERMVFQSQEFWEWFTPHMHQHFPHTKSVSADQFNEYVNQVHAGFIRVEADELTYPLHIILRFELEKGMFDGSISVADIPRVWNAKMKESLGLSVTEDSQGCLQDVHWSGGAMGYFPSYTLGAMIAAQLFEHIETTSIPDLRYQIRNGEFKKLREWLRLNIHQVGSLYESPDELLQAVTGKPLDPEIYIRYLEKKYSKLYHL